MQSAVEGTHSIVTMVFICKAQPQNWGLLWAQRECYRAWMSTQRHSEGSGDDRREALRVSKYEMGFAFEALGQTGSQ